MGRLQNKLDKSLKILTMEANQYANSQELNWIVNNTELLAEIIEGDSSKIFRTGMSGGIASILYPECLTESPFALGGLVYALKELDNATRKRLADDYANRLTLDAKDRIPHLEYIVRDSLTWNWFNPAGMFKRDRKDIEHFIAENKERASRDIRGYINDKTYVNWKINDLIKNLIAHNVKRETHHIDVIYYLFKKFEYEHYGHTSKNVDEVEHRTTIKKRLQNIHNAKLPHLVTVFKIWKNDLNVL